MKWWRDTPTTHKKGNDCTKSKCFGHKQLTLSANPHKQQQTIHHWIAKLGRVKSKKPKKVIELYATILSKEYTSFVAINCAAVWTSLGRLCRSKEVQIVLFLVTLRSTMTLISHLPCHRYYKSCLIILIYVVLLCPSPISENKQMTSVKISRIIHTL